MRSTAWVAVLVSVCHPRQHRASPLRRLLIAWSGAVVVGARCGANVLAFRRARRVETTASGWGLRHQPDPVWNRRPHKASAVDPELGDCIDCSLCRPAPPASTSAMPAERMHRLRRLHRRRHRRDGQDGRSAGPDPLRQRERRRARPLASPNAQGGHGSTCADPDGGLLPAASLAFAASITMRGPLQVDVPKDRGTLARFVEDGAVENEFGGIQPLLAQTASLIDVDRNPCAPASSIFSRSAPSGPGCRTA